MNPFVVVAIVAANLGLALGGLYLAWRLWKLKQSLAILSDALIVWERGLQDTLSLTADLGASRQQLVQLRQQYVLLQRWLGYLSYLRQGLNLMVGLGLKHRQRLRRRSRK